MLLVVVSECSGDYCWCLIVLLNVLECTNRNGEIPVKLVLSILYIRVECSTCNIAQKKVSPLTKSKYRT